MDNFLIIDLGTNTAIFSVVREENSSLIITYEKSITTRIGENIFTQDHISETVLERNVRMISEELRSIKERYRIHKAYAMTTEAVRSASNGDECIKVLSSCCGIKFEPISGEEEAKFTEKAVRSIEDKDPERIICDIGGGSTELTIIKKGKTVAHKSFKLGVVRLESEFGLSKSKDKNNDAVNKIKKVLEPVKINTGTLILCGGTATTIASIMKGLEDYDPDKVEGHELDLSTIDELISRLYKMDMEQIKELLKTDKGRSDVITAGAVMIRSLMDIFKPQRTLVTTLGPRHGFLIKKLGIKAPFKILYRLEN